MINTAQQFRAGGEVADHTAQWVIPMGSGASASAGYPQSAYLHDFAVCVLNQGCSFSFSPMDTAADNYLARGVYDHSTNNPFPNLWNNAFFFGNVPRVFWGQNFGYNQWNPDASFSQPYGYDWAYGYDKGECGYASNQASPLTGLSAYTSGQSQAHAVLCNYSPLVATTGANCYQVLFNPNSNQKCNSNGNWAGANAMGECNCSDFVLGVSQGNAGIYSLLCCPGSMGHTACTTQVFEGQNSSAYGVNSPDWDPYYYKGQCLSGQYVAGVSSVPNGAPYALLCCNP